MATNITIDTTVGTYTTVMDNASTRFKLKVYIKDSNTVTFYLENYGTYNSSFQYSLKLNDTSIYNETISVTPSTSKQLCEESLSSLLDGILKVSYTGSDGDKEFTFSLPLPFDIVWDSFYKNQNSNGISYGDATQSKDGLYVGRYCPNTEKYCVIRLTITTKEKPISSLTLTHNNIGRTYSYNIKRPEITLHAFLTRDSTFGIDKISGDFFDNSGNLQSNIIEQISLDPIQPVKDGSMTATIESTLQPNSTYYIFYVANYKGYNIDVGGANNYRTFHSDQTTIEYTTPNMVKIYTDQGWKSAIPFIYTGSGTNQGWKQAIPKIYDGSSWKDCQ